MKEYETVFVLHPQTDDAGIDREIEAVKRVIQDGGGQVSGVHKWGRRRLAYTIRKAHEGIYTLIRFQAEPTVLRELDRRYKINEAVLRHLTIHAVGDPMLRDARRERRGGRPGGPGPRGRGRGGRDDHDDFSDGDEYPERSGFRERSERGAPRDADRPAGGGSAPGRREARDEDPRGSSAEPTGDTQE